MWAVIITVLCALFIFSYSNSEYLEDRSINTWKTNLNNKTIDELKTRVSLCLILSLAFS